MSDLLTLALVRLHLTSIHASAAEWEALAGEYGAIGALSNMAACQRRAEQARTQELSGAQVEFIPAVQPVMA